MARSGDAADPLGDLFELGVDSRSRVELAIEVGEGEAQGIQVGPESIATGRAYSTFPARDRRAVGSLVAQEPGGLVDGQSEALAEVAKCLSELDPVALVVGYAPAPRVDVGPSLYRHGSDVDRRLLVQRASS